MTEPDRKLKTLITSLAELCWDGDSLDGGELQELLVAAEVLIAVAAIEPCGEYCCCRCRGYDVEPAWTCYRLSERFR
jgi:hypothetical protein